MPRNNVVEIENCTTLLSSTTTRNAEGPRGPTYLRGEAQLLGGGVVLVLASPARRPPALAALCRRLHLGPRPLQVTRQVLQRNSESMIGKPHRTAKPTAVQLYRKYFVGASNN